MSPHGRTVVVVLLLALSATAGFAITNGVPDDGEHPYVGQLLFYVPDEIDPRFTDPGGWFTCSGTLLSPTVMLTAGHCSFGIGNNGVATTATGGNGGNDVWVSFSEVPDFVGFPASANYIPDDNEQRYIDRAAFLDANSDWTRGTATTHPLFAGAPFVLHDAGVIEFAEPITSVTTFGRLPEVNYLDRFKATRRDEQRFTPVGYGLTRFLPHSTEGGDVRLKASVMLLGLKVFGLPEGDMAKFSHNNGTTHQGGTCFGDSGGPVLVGGRNLIVAITSFAFSSNCSGVDGTYRIDQQDDLDFLAGFGVTP